MKTDPLQLIERVIDACPDRVATSDSEARAVSIFEDEFNKVDGVTTSRHDFTYNRSLYANLAWHFGLSTLAAVLAVLGFKIAVPIAGLVALSYWADASKKFMLLRRVFPFRNAQNLLARMGPENPTRRIVLIGHADAAYTGFLFKPEIVRLATKEPPLKILSWTRRSMLVGVASVVALMVVSLVTWFVSHWLLTVLIVLCAIPSFITFALNVDVVLRNTIVPGAADNLSGCAAGVELAARFAERDLGDTELVFVVSSCEEASTGGALRLCQDYSKTWDREMTTVIAIDTLWGGTLRYLAEGEFGAARIHPELREAIEATSAESGRAIDEYDIPTGATDAWPFMQSGYKACAFVCVDPDLGAPRNYHLPADNMDNCSPDEFENAVEFIDAFVQRLL